MDYFTVDEFAEKMKMHPQSVRKAIREGKIYALRPGGLSKSPYRISESEIERLQIVGMCKKENQSL